MKSSKKTTPRVVSSKPFPEAVPDKGDVNKVGGIGNRKGTKDWSKKG